MPLSWIHLFFYFFHIEIFSQFLYKCNQYRQRCRRKCFAHAIIHTCYVCNILTHFKKSFNVQINSLALIYTLRLSIDLNRNSIESFSTIIPNKIDRQTVIFSRWFFFLSLQNDAAFRCIFLAQIENDVILCFYQFISFHIH